MEDEIEKKNQFHKLYEIKTNSNKKKQRSNLKEKQTEKLF